MKTILFYLSYTLVIMHNMFKAFSFVDFEIYNILYALALTTLAILGALNIRHLKIKKKLEVGSITLLLAAFTYFTHDVFLLTIWLTIIAFRNIEFKKIVLYDLILKTICILIVFVCYKNGMTNDNIIYDGERMISSLGFENPNIFSAYMLSIILDAVYLRKTKIGIFDIILVSSIALGTISLTNSRTQPIIMVSTVLLLAFCNRRKKKEKSGIWIRLRKTVTNNIFAIMACISLAVVSLFINNPSSDVLMKIDETFSGRLRVSSRVINNYGLDLVGNDSFFAKEVEESTIDNQYTYIAITYGIIPLVIVSIIMSKYMCYLSENNKKKIFIIMLMMIISGLAEKSCLRIQFNVFMLYMSMMFYNHLSEGSNNKSTIQKMDNL